MNTFAVGDVVEIIGSSVTRPEGQVSIGRQGIVIRTDIATAQHNLPGHQYCFLSPSELNHGVGWYSISLRKINPPDWQSPLTTEHEKERT